MVKCGECATLRPRTSATQQWLLQILALASSLGHFLANIQAREVPVGYDYGWRLPPNNFFYQDWVDGEGPWYSGDILDFSNSPGSHTVVEFPSVTAFSTCNVRSSATEAQDFTRVRLLHSTSGGWHNVYLGSPANGDCELGMKFQISFFTPYPSQYPPPPTTSYSTSPSFPPPSLQWSLFSRSSSGASPKKSAPPTSKKSKKSKSKNSKKSKKKGKSKALGVPLGVTLPIIAIVMCIAILYIYRKKYRKQKSKARDLDVLPQAQKTEAVPFTYPELEQATDFFSPTNLIRQGSAGEVMRGVLENGTVVAINRTRTINQDVEDDQGRFLQYVSMVSNLSHRGLVRLLGYCISPQQDRFLVWEYLHNGSLEHHLSVESPGELDWNTRLRIAVQVAEALERLHVQVTPPIHHGDVKSSNILLDENFNAKVAGLGFPSPKGTLGYADPANPDGLPSEHSDVYSFGVVLLELVTSRKPFDPDLPGEQQSLAARAIPLIASGRVQEIADPQVCTEQNAVSVIAVAKVAMACLEEAQTVRPSMTEVLAMLQDASILSLRGGNEPSSTNNSEIQTAPAGIVHPMREDEPIL